MTDLKTPQARTASPPDLPPLFGASYGYYGADDSIDLLECARLLYREWRLIAVIVGALTTVSLIAALSATPVYRAEALLVPVAPDKAEGGTSIIGQLGDLAALVGGYVASSKDQTAESIATLRSRSLAMDFVREHDLKRILFADQWDPQRNAWREADKAPSDLDAYAVFDTQVRIVHVDRRTGLVSLAVEWSNPALAASWANHLVREVNERRRSDVIREAEQSIKYLRRQVARVSSVEIQQSIYRLIEAQTKTIALANSRADYAFRVIDAAIPPERPIRPQRRFIVAAGFVLGLLVALAAVFVRHAVRTKRTRPAASA